MAMSERELIVVLPVRGRTEVAMVPGPYDDDADARFRAICWLMLVAAERRRWKAEEGGDQ